MAPSSRCSTRRRRPATSPTATTALPAGRGRQLLVAATRDEWPPRTVRRRRPSSGRSRGASRARASLRTAACVRLRDGFRIATTAGEDARERCSLRALRDGLRAAYVGRLGGDDDLDPVARAAARKAAGNDAFGAGAHDVALKRWGEPRSCSTRTATRRGCSRAAPAVPRAQGAGKIQDALADAQTVVDAGGDAARRSATAPRDELASSLTTHDAARARDFGTFSAACASAEASSTGALIADPEFDEADGQQRAQRRAAADPAALRQRRSTRRATPAHRRRRAQAFMAALEGAIAAGIPADDADMARARRDLQRHAARRDDDDDDAAAGELPGVLPEPQVPRL
ncbi:hypothetical protein JL720_16807 [Aureococcus anophagefferens]|nr:hypothetical protein JL720_16807 [Aureococcus anophagefferens]